MSKAREQSKSGAKSSHLVRTLLPTPWILLGSAPLVALAVLATACGAAPATSSDDGANPALGGEVVGTTQASIYAGATDNDQSAHGGVVSIKVGDSSTFELCTGTLIAPNVV